MIKNKHTISFDYTLITGLPVKVICTYGGSGILVIDKDTDDEISLLAISSFDMEAIGTLALDWAQFYIDLRNKVGTFLDEENT